MNAPEVHVFQPGSGPLPDSDPERCDECGEQEDHWRHYVPDPSLDLDPDGPGDDDDGAPIW